MNDLIRRHSLVLMLIWISFPLVFELPLWSVLLSSFIIAAIVLRDQFNFSLISVRLKNILAVVSLMATIFYFKTIKGYEPAMCFLLIISSLKALEISNERDVKVFLYFLVFLVIGDAIFYQTPLMAIHLLISLLFIFTYLLGLSRGTRQEIDLFQYFNLTLKMFLLVLPFVVVAFVIFPRIAAPIQGIGNEVQKAVTGFSDTLDPAQIINLLEDDTPVFRAQIVRMGPDQSINAKELYWRGTVLTSSNGHGWYAPDPLTRTLLAGDRGKLKKGSSDIRQQIVLNASYKNFLFTLDVPYAFANFSHQALADNYFFGQTYKTRRPIAVNIKYDVYSTSMGSLEQKKLSKLAQKEYLDYPLSLQNSRAALWLEEFKDAGQEEKLQKILAHFGQNFTYSMQTTPYLDGATFLDELMFKKKNGVCAHFASAFALLARMSGIPARIVVGYHGGEYNEWGDYWLIRENNAHAWVEVFDEGQGWQRIDPTFVVSPAMMEPLPYLTADAPSYFRIYYRSKMYIDGIDFRFSQFLLNYDYDYQKEVFARMLGVNFDYPRAFGVVAFAVFILMLVLIFADHLNIFTKRNHDLVYKMKKEYALALEIIKRKGISAYVWECPSAILKKSHAHKNISSFLSVYIDVSYGKTNVSESDLLLVKRLRKNIGR